MNFGQLFEAHISSPAINSDQLPENLHYPNRLTLLWESFHSVSDKITVLTARHFTGENVLPEMRTQVGEYLIANRLLANATDRLIVTE